MKWISTLTYFWMVSLTASLANASEVQQYFADARSMGMGRASIAVVDDETALISNPAALGKVREFYGALLNSEADGGVDLASLYSSQNFSDPFNPAAINGTLQSSPSSHYFARAQVFPSIVIRNFGFGIFGRYQLDAQLTPDQTQLNTQYLNDFSAYLGYSLRLFDGRIKIGITGKAISRIEINKPLQVNQPLDLQDNASEGLGIGADVGVILAAPWTWLPTASAVLRDVGNTSYNAASGLRMTTATRPATTMQDMDVAVALFPIHGNYTRSTITAEVIKLNEMSSAIDKTRYLHAGYEFNYGDLFFLRAGLNQHYWTAGLEYATEHTQLQFATYGEDVGPDGSPQEDRRLVMKFSFRF